MALALPTDEEAEGRPRVKLPTESAPRINFKHTPIDLTSNSIRLVEVLPRDTNSPNDTLRCTIRHATTTSSYTCLSYVWGPERPSESGFIELNGESFAVRRNLWDFLEVASSNEAREHNVGINGSCQPNLEFAAATRSLWIDALCIDQETISERNHQVQHMGMIYSGAQQVIAWFGKDLRLSEQFRRAREALPGSQSTPDTVARVGREFCRHVYWRRAWITQETILAKQLFYLAKSEAIHRDTFNASIQSYLTRFDPSLDDNILRLQYKKTFDAEERIVSSSLIDNLFRFERKECSNPRDQIYSLLSISRNGPVINVRYEISTFDLAKTVCGTIKRLCLCIERHFDWIFSVLGVNRYDMGLLMELSMYPPRMESGSCDRCSAVVDAESLREDYCLDNACFYCLACSHSADISYGHILLVRKHHTGDQNSWHIFWLVRGTITRLDEGIALRTMGADGSVTFDVTSSCFFRLAEPYRGGGWQKRAKTRPRGTTWRISQISQPNDARGLDSTRNSPHHGKSDMATI